ncbi:hypothetical protein PAECIP111802_05486 [Paenibacillus allorhizosphaerae]|uniref:HIRAN domain-containing protein n=1 Tax=Paenibacillus allorhizosphaerae TaxID=2849866 RepID=A0ABM8VQ20_9BACL|nr:hypothetical protein PAECIP111802_05486 [Paenibacillus allorhizosphaerae]
MVIGKTSRMNLMARLATHLHREVALQAEGFESEPGVLQKVGKRFIRVNGQFFVPATMQEIVLLDNAAKGKGTQLYVRTTYGRQFQAKLVRSGVDFVELVVSRQEEEEEELLVLIPLNKIIGLGP